MLASFPWTTLPVLKTQTMFWSQLEGELDLPWYTDLFKLINKYHDPTSSNTKAKQSALTAHIMEDEFVDNWMTAAPLLHRGPDNVWQSILSCLLFLAEHI